MKVVKTLRFISLAAVLGAGPVFSQETTNTNCNVFGNQVSCSSTTTDNSAQQQQMNQAGQQIGNALGRGMGLAIRAHREKKDLKEFCESHPGWTIGGEKCLSDKDKINIAANRFMAHHKEFVPEQANATRIAEYIGVHKLDPREEKSYERAFGELRKNGTVDVYRK